MTEGSNPSEPASETESSEKTSASGKKRSPWIMIAAIAVVLILLGSAVAIMFWPKKETTPPEVVNLTASVSANPFVLEAGESKEIQVYTKNGNVNLTDNPNVTYRWTVDMTVGELLIKGSQKVKLDAVKEDANGTIRCEVKYRASDGKQYSVTPTSSVRIKHPYLESIQMSPSTRMLSHFRMQNFTATAVSSVGTVLPVTDFTWTVWGATDTDYDVGSLQGQPWMQLTSHDVDRSGMMVNATATYKTVDSEKTKTGTAHVSITSVMPPRSVDYRWYDMFNVPFGQWWYFRLSEKPIINTYPYVFEWKGPGEGNIYYYSDLRLNISARNLSEINTNSMTQDKSILIPHWGIGTGGNVVLDWYVQYPTTDQINESYPSLYTQYDGWLVIFKGNITLDKQAAIGMLGITSDQFDDSAAFNTWWAANKIRVTNDYQGWLMSEGGPQHYWITPAFGSDMFLLGMKMNATKTGDKVVLKVQNVGWGMEMLISRWFRYTFMTTEWYFEDFRMHAEIGPETTNLDVDTAIAYGMYAYETTLTPTGADNGEPCWVWEAMKQDYTAYAARADVPGAEHPNSEMNPYVTPVKQKYYNTAPGSDWYGQWMDYDYTPGIFNLTVNETLSFEWPEKDMTFFLGTGIGTYALITDKLKLDYGEPMPKDLADITPGGNIVVDQAERTLTYYGPIDFFNWSKTQTSDDNLHNEWARLGGKLLPYGAPYIEWKVNSTPEPMAYRFEVTGIDDPIALGATSDVTVTCYDQYGAVYEDYAGTVHFTTNWTGSSTLPTDYTFDPATDHGVHTFSSTAVSFTGTLSDVQLVEVNVTDTSKATVNGIQVVHLLPSAEVIDHFTVVGITDMNAGDWSEVTVTAYDQYGFVFKGYTGTVAFSSNATSGATLPADYAFVTGDAGAHRFTHAVKFTEPGNYTVMVADLATPSATGSQANIDIMLSPEVTYTVYDMFEQPWREWWWQRSAYDVDIVLSNSTHNYTFIYNQDGGAYAAIIYAPYRWNTTADNMSTLSVNKPEFMPTYGPKDVPDAHAEMALHWEYLNWTWWNSYWAPTWEHNPRWIAADYNNTVMMMMGGDGYELGVVYTIEMNREAALTWFNMSLSDTPAAWWAANESAYMSAWSTWLDYEGNTRLDIAAGYDDLYYDLGEIAAMTELPDGNVSFTLVHFSWGFEVLTTRWLAEAKICEHSTYMEDFTLSAQYREKSADVTFDAVCQWNLHAVKANQSANGSAWVWEPMNIDYVTMSGHPSNYAPWASLMYADWNAGDPNNGLPLGSPFYYETTPLWMNLTSYQKLIIRLPTRSDVIGYKGVNLSADAILNAYFGDKTQYEAITVYGEMTLGYFMTGGVDLAPMYDAVSKTLTIVGPQQFDNYHWYPGGPIYHGAPWIEFNVTPGGSTLSLPAAGAAPSAPASMSAEVSSLAAVMAGAALAVCAIAVGAWRRFPAEDSQE